MSSIDDLVPYNSHSHVQADSLCWQIRVAGAGSSQKERGGQAVFPSAGRVEGLRRWEDGIVVVTWG